MHTGIVIGISTHDFCEVGQMGVNFIIEVNFKVCQLCLYVDRLFLLLSNTLDRLLALPGRWDGLQKLILRNVQLLRMFALFLVDLLTDWIYVGMRDVNCAT